MKVKVLKSDYSHISIGMKGEAKPMPVGDWFEVEFQDVPNPVPGYTTSGIFIGAFKKDQLEFLEDTKELPEYSKFVQTLCKSGSAIALGMTGMEAHLLHMAVGISGEAGEIIDAIKRHVIYRKALDVENVKEELGDLEFYMEGLRGALGISRDEVIEGNKQKLSKRFHSLTYQDSHAQERADKA
jgi:NTP pyrophosphatase (non-canonical NTP hydrolase)